MLTGCHRFLALKNGDVLTCLKLLCQEKKKKKGNKSFWREVSACQLTEIQLKVCRDLSEYGPYPSQLSENHHLPARAYLTL